MAPHKTADVGGNQQPNLNPYLITPPALEPHSVIIIARSKLNTGGVIAQFNGVAVFIHGTKVAEFSFTKGRADPSINPQAS